MEPSRKNKVRELYNRIDELERSLTKAGSNSERAKITRQLRSLREEVGRLLEPETQVERPNASLISKEQSHKNPPASSDNPSFKPSVESPKTAKPPQDSSSQKKLQVTSHRAKVEPKHSRDKTTDPPPSKTSRSFTEQPVSRLAARDYVYKRLDELTEILLSKTGTEREEARKERAFLERQLKIMYSKGQRKVKLDPELVRLVRESNLRSASPARKKNPERSAPTKAINTEPRKAPVPRSEQPAYWDKCRKMGFRQLRQFIDDSLKELPELDLTDRPRSKEEFLALLEILRGKIDLLDLPEILPDPGKPPEFPPFAPSDQLKPLLDQQKQLTAALTAALSNPSATKRSIKKLQRKLKLLEQEITPLVNFERQDYTKRRNAYLRPYLEAKVAHERSIWQRKNQRETSGRSLRELRPRRLQFIERVRKDIERAFKDGAVLPTSRLPWRLLPPGELSVGTILEHYARLEWLNPHIRYERERITKAFSLRPDQCYLGKDELDFKGYHVFTFAHTSKALLECPMFGNAIYIIGSDWKRLSRMPKRELLANHSHEVTKIVHKGDWFQRVKRELGIR